MAIMNNHGQSWLDTELFVTNTKFVTSGTLEPSPSCWMFSPDYRRGWVYKFWTKSSGPTEEPILGSQSIGNCPVLCGHQRGVCDFGITLRCQERRSYRLQTKRNRSLRNDWWAPLMAYGSPKIYLCERKKQIMCFVYVGKDCITSLSVADICNFDLRGWLIITELKRIWLESIVA